MATEKDFELLDDYLTNRLSEQERSAFEQQLQADPDLKNQHALQQKLVKGIQEVRKAELKTMLNNVPIPAVPHGGASLVAKFALGTILTGAVATGIYLYLNNNQEENTLQPTVIEKVEPPKTDVPVTQPETSQADKEQPAASGDQKVDAEKKPEQKSEKKQESVSSQEQKPTQPVLDVYDPSAESENGNTASKEEAAASTDMEPAGSSIMVEIDRQNKKYSFHYQFKEGKLFLYGPFEKNLYEIMEFFSGDKRTVFLYYKEGYYLLNDADSKIKSLAPISDQNLINKLREYRKK